MLPTGNLKHLLQYNGARWHYYEKNKDSICPVVVDNIIKMLSCGDHIRGFASYANGFLSPAKVGSAPVVGKRLPVLGSKNKWISYQRLLGNISPLLCQTPYGKSLELTDIS